jgi:hypothetical protein
MAINKIIDWILKILGIIGTFILGFFILDKVNIGKIKKTLSFDKVPGHKGKVKIINKDGRYKIKDLPKDPETGKKIKIDEIVTIGIPDKAYDNKDDNKKEMYNVEIKHNITDRRVKPSIPPG